MVSSTPGSTVVLCTVGTRGDIAPFLSMAEQLISAGHKVIILTNDNWRGDVVAIGAVFFSISPKEPSQTDRVEFDFFLTHTRPSFDFSYEYIERMVANGERPIVIYRTGMLGAHCAAQNFGLIDIRIGLQPSAIVSYERPQWPLSRLTGGIFGNFTVKVLVPFMHGFGQMFSRHRRQMNQFRKSVGLEAETAWTVPDAVEDAVAMLCPEWFCIPQADWPANCEFMGFPGKKSSAIDPNIVDFIEEFGPPIVFTPGTGVDGVETLGRSVCSAVEQTDYPLLMLSPHFDKSCFAAPNVLVHPFAELDSLLPRCRALIHHGGIGTTAAAIRSGTAQLILADRFDQPDNAVRVAEFGLGGGILDYPPKASTVYSALKTVLDSADVKQQVQHRKVLSGEDNAEKSMLKLVERLISDKLR